MGDAYFDVDVAKSDAQYTVIVTGEATDYRLEIGAYLPTDVRIVTVTLNDHPVEWQWKETLSGRSIVCEAAVPAVFRVHWTL